MGDSTPIPQPQSLAAPQTRPCKYVEGIKSSQITCAQASARQDMVIANSAPQMESCRCRICSNLPLSLNLITMAESQPQAGSSSQIPGTQAHATKEQSWITCHTCLRMRARKSVKQLGPAKRCLLCNTDYCDKHKSSSVPETCEMNHFTYSSAQRHRDEHRPVQIFRTMKEREERIAKNGDERVARSETAERLPSSNFMLAPALHLLGWSQCWGIGW